eukprot:TRINITY_DN8336_c0_g1_i1.p1 TRINITY_DN8336_c0_g1~~TRINITY_DN8336_c0_g1_i1.p1  ORF type:complete len:364 (+),score=78.71 TRINITY_DN8336_c0_g1_i1:133-1224(+)
MCIRDRPITMPATSCPGGTWKLSPGSNGQGSTSFYMNGSFFVIGRQACPGSSSDTNTTLFQLYGRGSYLRPTPLPQLDEMDLSAIHMAWDWTCNIAVLVPNQHGGFVSLEVSEYDGQVRTLVSLDGPEDKWTWMKGLTALDIGHFNNSYSSGTESNCGREGCAVYTKEQPGSNQPGNIIGRLLHTGKLVSNITDPTQMGSMSFLPKNGWGALPEASDRILEHWSKGALSLRAVGAATRIGDVFVGLGVCCELEWCDSECEGHGGELTLVSWGSDRSIWPRILTVLGPDSKKAAEASLQLGVAVDIFGYPVGPEEYATRVSVWSDGKILSYKLNNTDYGTPQVEQIATSKDVGRTPLLWGYLME